MSITVHQHNADQTQAVSELAAKGLHTLVLDVEPVQNESHWHHFDAEFYILSGDLEISDGATAKVHRCGPGSVVVVPARSVHAEFSKTGYRIVLGSSVPPEQFGEPVNRPVSSLGEAI